MPNYCSNTLQITGDPDAVDQCVERIRDLDPDNNDGRLLDFARIIPEPARVALPANPLLATRHIDPVKRAWGTKNNCIGGQLIDNGPGDVVLLFDTAWSPPSRWLYAVIELFPQIEFELVWRELGNGEAGEIRGEDGTVVSDIEETDDPYTFLRERGFDVHEDEEQ